MSLAHCKQVLFRVTRSVISLLMEDQEKDWQCDFFLNRVIFRDFQY